MKIEKNNAKFCPPDSDEEVTITFTGKELGFIYDSLVLLMESDISKLNIQTSFKAFGISLGVNHYTDSSLLVSRICELRNLLSDFDKFMELF